MVLSFSIAGVVVIVVLAVIAWRLWKQVWQKEAEIKTYQQEVIENEQKRLDHVYESLNVIACALLDEQVRVSEGSIRMAVLLSNLPLSCDSKHRFAPFFEVYNLSQHIPTHSKWKALDRKQQHKFEKELLSIEKEYTDKVKVAAEFIKANPFGTDHAHEVRH